VALTRKVTSGWVCGIQPEVFFSKQGVTSLLRSLLTQVKLDMVHYVKVFPSSS